MVSDRQGGAPPWGAKTRGLYPLIGLRHARVIDGSQLRLPARRLIEM
jgi:hypothetical protein